jgi:HD-GYP domain-containing protein (c-di-GMP phosphodiesterase class II)
MEMDQYLPIQSLDIEAESTIPFDIFVNLPLNKKIILYRKKGGEISAAKMQKFTENNVKNFFVDKKDYNEFVKYVALKMRNLVGAKDSETNRKMMAQTAKSILSSTLNQTDPAIANALMGNLNDITGIVIESSLTGAGVVGGMKMFSRLVQLADKGTDFQKHPVNVASLAVLITFGIGYSSARALSDMAMAALLHDVGLSKCPTKVIPFAHNLVELPMEERDYIYKHPEYSIEILQEKGVELSNHAKIIIEQHHEEFNGFGYPKGLRGFHINEMAQVLKVADELDQIINAIHVRPVVLKEEVRGLLNRLRDDKVVEANLLGRIRAVLI